MGSLGMPEILLILVIALIIFGPRKLPELGKSLGQGLAHFRKASEDFKRQWEDEVSLERQRLDAPPPPAAEPQSYSEQRKDHEPSISTQHEASPSNESPTGETAASSTAGHQTGSVARDAARDWA